MHSSLNGGSVTLSFSLCDDNNVMNWSIKLKLNKKKFSGLQLKNSILLIKLLNQFLRKLILINIQWRRKAILLGKRKI